MNDRVARGEEVNTVEKDLPDRFVTVVVVFFVFVFVFVFMVGAFISSPRVDADLLRIQQQRNAWAQYVEVQQ